MGRMQKAPSTCPAASCPANGVRLKGRTLRAGTQSPLSSQIYTTEHDIMRSRTTSSVAISMTEILKTAPLLIVFLLLLIAPASSHAQDPTESLAPINAQGGISYSAAFPTGEFGDAVGRTAHGVNLYYGRRVGSLPLYLGIDVDIGQYGSEEQAVDIFGVDGTFRTDSFLYQPHVSARYQPVTGRFRPFFEGLVGANILTTSTTWKDFGTTVEAPQDADETSVAFSAGLGVGLDVRVARVKPFGLLGLTGSVHYIYGSEADAPVAEGVAVEEANLSTVSTNTSLLQPQVGLYLEF